MIIRTHIIQLMRIAFIPLNQLIISTMLKHCRRIMFIMNNWFQQPRTRNHSMGFQQFKTCRCAHLTRNHRENICFSRYFINCNHLTILNHKGKPTLETLIFFTFPVKIDTNHHIFKFKITIFRRIILLFNRRKMQRIKLLLKETHSPIF